MRRKLLEAGKHHIAVPGEGEHQGLLRLCGRRKDLAILCIFTGIAVFLSDGVDSRDRVENIRTCISLKGSKSVDIEDIVLCGLVREIAVF